MKYIDAEKLIERLEEMKQAEYENCGGVNAKTGALYEVQNLIDTLQHEQPEVDLEKEIIRYKVPFSDDREYLNETTLDAIAHHFYELGCRHAAVLYDDMEKERQRRQEEEPTIKGWVARDSCEDAFNGCGLILHHSKPWRTGAEWSNRTIAMHLPWGMFPDLKWEDEPIEVELTIIRI